jgi:hypothetical protein
MQLWRALGRATPQGAGVAARRAARAPRGAARRARGRAGPAPALPRRTMPHPCGRPAVPRGLRPRRPPPRAAPPSGRRMDLPPGHMSGAPPPQPPADPSALAAPFALTSVQPILLLAQMSLHPERRLPNGETGRQRVKAGACPRAAGAVHWSSVQGTVPWERPVQGPSVLYTEPKPSAKGFQTAARATHQVLPQRAATTPSAPPAPQSIGAGG